MYGSEELLRLPDVNSRPWTVHYVRSNSAKWAVLNYHHLLSESLWFLLLVLALSLFILRIQVLPPEEWLVFWQSQRLKELNSVESLTGKVSRNVPPLLTGVCIFLPIRLLVGNPIRAVSHASSPWVTSLLAHTVWVYITILDLIHIILLQWPFLCTPLAYLTSPLVSVVFPLLLRGDRLLTRSASVWFL